MDILLASDGLKNVAMTFLHGLDPRPKYEDGSASKHDDGSASKHDDGSASLQNVRIAYIVKRGTPSRMEEGLRSAKEMLKCTPRLLVSIICVQDNRDENQHKVLQALQEDRNNFCIMLHCFQASTKWTLHRCHCNKMMVEQLRCALHDHKVDVKFDKMFVGSETPPKQQQPGDKALQKAPGATVASGGNFSYVPTPLRGIAEELAFKVFPATGSHLTPTHVEKEQAPAGAHLYFYFDVCESTDAEFLEFIKRALENGQTAEKTIAIACVSKCKCSFKPSYNGENIYCMTYHCSSNGQTIESRKCSCNDTQWKEVEKVCKKEKGHICAII